MAMAVVALALALLLQHGLCLNQEGLYMQKVKLGLDDPDGALADWDEKHDTPCKWRGVTCDDAATTGSVVAVDLSSFNVAGPFPTVLCRLPRLSFISLYNNSMNSTLPAEVATCGSLEHLDLAQNYFTGGIPESLAELTSLKYLDLAGNNFSGDIPASFGRFQKLEVLSLVNNLLDGPLPSLLGNISTLKQLNLSYNPYTPSKIPPELGQLANLEILWLTQCGLIGEIPDAIGNLRKLTDLDLAANNLHGPIPSSITDLASVVQIELYNNSLSGKLPDGMSKMKSLRLFDASANLLEGEIPEELCSLPLESLHLYENRLTGGVPESIAESPNLFELRLFDNRLTGDLPRDLGKNSPLSLIDVSFNNFTGGIPVSLCSQGYLEELLLMANSLSGPIPDSFGECRSLTRVRLSENRLSGDVPAGFWGLPSVSLLELKDNSLTGQIGSTISNATRLSQLLIDRNQFSGELPEEMGELRSLIDFSAGDNKFSGTLPGSIVKLEMIGRLDLRNNELTGEIPGGICSWKKLNDLNLANNELSGRIPDEIGKLSVLNYLDLSGNKLSGKLPFGLQNLKLNLLNLSSNHLSGPIPPLYAKASYKSSFLGNPGLCGELDGLCEGDGGSRRRGYDLLLGSIFTLAALVFVVGVALFYWRYKSFQKARSAADKSKWTLMSFHKLGFDEHEILESLDEDNVIGCGRSGKVYKAVLSNGEVVAVKRLWGGSKLENESGDDVESGHGHADDDGFDAEVNTLGKIRHKNIVKLWCCCATRDCKLLVYEYMPNGSLGDLLHGSKSGLLDWPMRFKIALDTAEGLSYLHHDCAPPIVHRDVKSNNILLDAGFGARVADFGVAKAVDAIGKSPKSMSIIAGSCGYIAPEYAYTLRVNEKSDIYSFGVVLLELVTGRRPVEPEFGEKDLVKWVCATLDQKGPEHVIDPKLDSCFGQEISHVLNVGLLCTNPLPINRPSMRRVVKLLQELVPEIQLKGATDKEQADKDGKRTPYYYEDSSDQGSVA
uniref:non-specific serine/threonine protein kinase n=1 Tax=Kalanchoe fedtschenkoi TaxID=63787 RepID=A0A7N0R982_KALFE